MRRKITHAAEIFLRRLCVGLQATARLVNCPRFVSLDHAAESLLRRQALVNVDSDAERRAGVRLSVRDAASR
jgi:hypothetical protein